MSPIKGKQTKDDPINKLIHFRTNKETAEKLEYIAEKTGLSKSEVIRNGIDIQYQELKK